MTGRFAGCVLPLILAACTAEGRGSGAQEGAGMASGLDVVAEAVPEGPEVRLRLRLANAADSAITLEFPSGQRYDFAVARPGGESLWRWSAARSFIAEYGTETLAPGEALEYVERWDPAGATGRVVVEATLTSANLPVGRSVDLTLPPP